MLLGEEDMSILYHGSNMIVEKPESLADQVLFHTPVSLHYLRFIDSEDVIQ